MKQAVSTFKNGRAKKPLCASTKGCDKKAQGSSVFCWNHFIQLPANRTAAKDRELLRRYNLPLGQFDELIKIQNGVCGICGSSQPFLVDGKPTALCVDHDHRTGVVRGLLCTPCNVALGHFKDDPRLLSRALMWIGMAELPDEKFVWVTEGEN